MVWVAGKRRWRGDGVSSRPPTAGRVVSALFFFPRGGSAQIARELVISPSTVLHHVTNILAKTGGANRTEAAMYAVRNGIV